MGVRALLAASKGGPPPIDTSYPTPGSGTYHGASLALDGISYADIGTPTAATGGVDSVQNPATGLWRSKYDGNFCVSSSNTVGSYDLTWFNGKTPLASLADTYISWGNQSDGPNPGQHNFSIEWLGYINLTSQKWNFYVESDDTCAVWIGDAAVSGFSAGNCLVSSSNKTLPTNAGSSHSNNSLIFDDTKWYPVRIWFSEFGGGCKFQLYALGEDGTKLQGNTIATRYDNTTKGFNP
jgi:GLEYA domain